MRQFICRSLRLSGLAIKECREASNGREALVVMHEHPINVILCDINMPQMDGEELLNRIEQDPQLRLIPTIVISADATAPRLQRMLDLGAQAYLIKPFLPELLVSTIKQVLSPRLLESAQKSEF
jgi:two-component system chemotaxis response regulator CheY